MLGPPSKDVALAPAPAPAREGGASPLVLIGFGAAALGVGVGGVTGVMAFAKKSTADEECTGTFCTQVGMDAVEAGRTLGTVSTIGFVVGGVGAAVGLYGLVWGSPGTRPSVAVSAGPTGAALRGTF